MVSRKMTFTVPGDLAQLLLRRVPSRERSAYVSKAIAAKLLDPEECLIRACAAANRDMDIAAIEQEWDFLQDRVAEPWHAAEAR